MNSFFLSLIMGLITTVVGSQFTLSNDDSGNFNISVDGKTWFQSEDICLTSQYKTYCRDNGSLKKINSTKSSGFDSYGTFQAILINWKAGDADFGTLVREYSDRATIIFQQIFPNKI